MPQVRCSRYLYTLCVADADKADKLKQSLPPGERRASPQLLLFGGSSGERASVQPQCLGVRSSWAEHSRISQQTACSGRSCRSAGPTWSGAAGGRQQRWISRSLAAASPWGAAKCGQRWPCSLEAVLLRLIVAQACAGQQSRHFNVQRQWLRLASGAMGWECSRKGPALNPLFTVSAVAQRMMRPLNPTLCCRPARPGDLSAAVMVRSAHWREQPRRVWQHQCDMPHGAATPGVT